MLVLREPLGETGACLAKELLITGGTGTDTDSRRTGMKQAAAECVSLAKDKPALERVKWPTEGVDFHSAGQAEERQVRNLSERRLVVGGSPRPG